VVSAGAGAVSQAATGMYYRGDGTIESRLAPGMLMTALNYQLFRSTPPEEHATMLLGCYAAAAQRADVLQRRLSATDSAACIWQCRAPRYFRYGGWAF
jgi:hypothetical protein